MGAARDYVPHYACSAFAVDLAWAQPQRDVATRALRALRDAVTWSRDHIDETAAVVVEKTRSELTQVIRALQDLYDDEVISVHVGREALGEVTASARQAGLVEDDASLQYEGIVDGSITVE